MLFRSQVVDTGSVYIKADPPNAGHSILTLAVANLEMATAALESRDVALTSTCPCLRWL